MNAKEKFYQKIQEATMSQLNAKLEPPDRMNDVYKSVKKNIDSKLEMDKIQNDPKLALGYDTLKDKDTGIMPVKKNPPLGAWGSFNPGDNSISMRSKDMPARGIASREPDNPIPAERYKATTAHEIGHAASERLNPVNKKDGQYHYGNMPLKYGANRTPVVTDTGKIRYHDPGTEELRQRRADLTYRTGKPREDSLKWTTALHDRDQQALDKINDTDRNKARQILYKKYGAADRSTMTDRDLGKTATGTIIPEEIKMDIKENFYSKLQIIREEAEVKPNRNSEVVRTQKAAEKALGHLKKNDYERARAAVERTPLKRHLRTHLDNAQKHWTKANELNNSSIKAKSEKHYNEIRNRANDHQDQAEHHHGKASQFLKDHLPMNEEAEQLDELKGLKGYRRNPRLLRKVGKRATNRVINATDPMWTSKSGMSDEDRNTARRYRDVGDWVSDRLGEQ